MGSAGGNHLPQGWDFIVAKEKIRLTECRRKNIFPGEIAKKALAKPMGATETSEKYYFSAKVSGGGKESQLGAVILGLARSLVKVSSEKNRVPLKKLGLSYPWFQNQTEKNGGNGWQVPQKKTISKEVSLDIYVLYSFYYERRKPYCSGRPRWHKNPRRNRTAEGKYIKN